MLDTYKKPVILFFIHFEFFSSLTVVKWKECKAILYLKYTYFLEFKTLDLFPLDLQRHTCEQSFKKLS